MKLGSDDFMERTDGGPHLGARIIDVDLAFIPNSTLRQGRQPRCANCRFFKRESTKCQNGHVEVPIALSKSMQIAGKGDVANLYLHCESNGEFLGVFNVAASRVSMQRTIVSI